MNSSSTSYPYKIPFKGLFSLHFVTSILPIISLILAPGWFSLLVTIPSMKFLQIHIKMTAEMKKKKKREKSNPKSFAFSRVNCFNLKYLQQVFAEKECFV